MKKISLLSKIIAGAMVWMILLSQVSYALTYVVSTTADTTGGICGSTLVESSDCSIRDAITAANNLGEDTIDLTQTGGEFIDITEGSPLTVSDDYTHIVGTEALDIIGTDVGNSFWVLYLGSSHNTVDNLTISGMDPEVNAISISGDDNTITNSHLNTNSDATGHVGGKKSMSVIGNNNKIGLPLNGNYMGGTLEIGSGDGNVIKGNRIGIGESNDNIAGNTPGSGIIISGLTGQEVTVGGGDPDDGNYIGNSGGDDGAIEISIADADSTVNIYNNSLGIAPNGEVAMSNASNGIMVTSNFDGILNIGNPGVGPDWSNIISGFNGHGIVIGDNGGRNNPIINIKNNFIGTDSGEINEFPNAGWGINISNTDAQLTITNNRLYNNLTGGLSISNSSSSTNTLNLIDANRIYYNSGFGISIDGDSSAVIGGDHFLFEGNDIIGNVGAGIYITSYGDVSVLGNNIADTQEWCVVEGFCMGSGILVSDLIFGDGIPIDVIGVTIGGEGGYANKILANAYSGIKVMHMHQTIGLDLLIGGTVDGLQILGNYIGVDPDLPDDNTNGNGTVQAGEDRDKGSGIVVDDMNNDGAITNLTIGANNAGNVIGYNNMAGIYAKYLSGGMIYNNVIRNGFNEGIVLEGASPTIDNNTIQDNNAAGITAIAKPGDDPSPNGFADDALAEPTVTDNTFDGNCVGNGAFCADMTFVDSASANYETLYADNTFIAGNNDYVIIQVWRGIVEVLDELGDPIANGVNIVTDNIYGLLNVYNGGVWGVDNLDYNDVRTWPFFLDYMITSDGLVISSNPTNFTVTVDGLGEFNGSYNFNGQSHTETGFGLPIDRNGRYQIAEVLAINDNGGSDGGYIQDREVYREPEIVVDPGNEDIVETDTEVAPDTNDNSNNDAVANNEDVNNETNAEVIEDFTSPVTLDEVSANELYTNEEYKREALLILVETCSSATTGDCLKKIYDLPNVSEKEFGDAVVFGKKPGEIITDPRIVNLDGRTVGSDPVILVISEPNDTFSIDMTYQIKDTIVEGDGLKLREVTNQSAPVLTISGTTDEEGKAVLHYEKPLVKGDYDAQIFAKRGNEKIPGVGAKFNVDPRIDREFYVESLQIKQEDEHAKIETELGGSVDVTLKIDEKVDPEFDADQYVEFRRTGGKVYVVSGRVQMTDSLNKMVYFTYQSVIMGSAVIADASQNGSFKAKVPVTLASGKHTLNVFAYDPKDNKTTSVAAYSFEKK